MRSVVIPIVSAVLLALVGAWFYTTGRAEGRVADLHQQLATLKYAAAAAAGADLEGSLDFERRLPIVGPQQTTDVHDAATTARYWEADYTGVQPQKDAGGATTDTDPAVLLLGANAAFRASQSATDRADTLRRLDGVVKSYADALRANGQQVDTAYNYEYSVRVRDALGKARPGAPGKSAAVKPAAAGDSDLPSGPSLHGRQGAPPTKSEMSQFKIVIPKRGDERKDNPEAGKGGQKIRRG